MGFGVPIANWFRTAWSDGLKSYIYSTKMLELFKQDELEKMVESHMSKKADHSYALFDLLVLAIFLGGQ